MPATAEVFTIAMIPAVDLAAPVWFVICWFGYSYWADSRPGPHLASVMHNYRRDWTHGILRRENRMVDVMVMGHLMTSVQFFASTSLFVIGGLLAVLGARQEAMAVLNELPLIPETPALVWQLKVLLLIVVFIYSFFKFTWAFRHYNYALILLGTIPEPRDMEPAYEDTAERMATLTTSTAKHFNRGVRAYYFGLAALSWIIHAWLFMALSVWVVLILYRREFRSNLLRTLGEPGPGS